MTVNTQLKPGYLRVHRDIDSPDFDPGCLYNSMRMSNFFIRAYRGLNKGKKDTSSPVSQNIHLEYLMKEDNMTFFLDLQEELEK